MLSAAKARSVALSALRAAPYLVFGQGSKSAEEEAEWLVTWLLRQATPDKKKRQEATLSGATVSSALLSQSLTRRIRYREPMAFITGFTTLCGLEFCCDERALIPRSYIAELLSEWPSHLLPSSCLDLCTGNGNLAVSAALRIASIQSVIGSDISEAALQLAQKNVEMHGVGKRVRLVRGDLFESVSNFKFDLILCNPPYVKRSAMRKLPEEFLKEPQSALDGGETGLDFCVTVARESLSKYLTVGGVLVLETGWGQMAAMRRLFPRNNVEFIETSAGVGPVMVVQRKA